ncbi:hypothetical protein LguiB_008802 [Lonicera macranthoides]
MESSTPHMVLFPFMSKGHTIPLLHLAHLLLRRTTTVTIFTTPSNRPFISHSLAGSSATILDLPFPQNVPGIPTGIESTDKLPSISLYPAFAKATKLMQPHFEQALIDLLPVTCIISDGFLSWTLQSARNLGIPRISFYGTSNYSMAVQHDLGAHQLLSVPESNSEPITSKSFPWIKVTRNDFDEPFNRRDPKGPHFDFVLEQIITTSESYGLIVNSFYKLEPVFFEYWNRESQPKAWCIGPLCLAEPRVEGKTKTKPRWVNWLDIKQEQGSSVLYVAFGSQAEISKEQFREIAKGLEESKVNFLWVARKNEDFEFVNEFEERVGERGMIVREWVDQREILRHESVKGFLSHCGWNSVVESMCAKVPVLAWPMMAEQPLNAKMVVEEIKIGLRVEGSGKGFVKWESLKKSVKELMEGEMGKEVRKKVIEVGEDAIEAMAEGGSSWKELNQLIDKLHVVQKMKNLKSSS